MDEKLDDPQHEADEPAASLEELEAALLNSLLGSSRSAAQGLDREHDRAGLARQYNNIVPRLALLEENVARMCNALGRLEQSFAAFQSTLEKK
jgi:hypothetical protein